MTRIYTRGKKGVFWIDYIFEGCRFRKSLHVTSRTAAEEKLVAARKALARGEQPFTAGKTTLGTLLAEYIEWCEDVCLNSPKTLRDKKRYIRRYKEYWGEDRKILTITRAEVEAYMAYRQRKSKSVILPNREYQTLRHFFAFAETRNHVHRNPCIGVKKFPGEERYRKPIRVLTVNEIAEWLSFLNDHDELLYNLTVIALFTGQRCGDVLAIRGADVRGKTWYCRQSKKAGELNAVELTGPSRQVVEKLKILHGEGYLFPGKSPGTHLTTYRRRFNQAKRFLCFNFAFKDLRHTCASYLAKKGVPLVSIKKQLGHSRLSTTERYVKVPDGVASEALEDLSEQIYETVFDEEEEY